MLYNINNIIYACMKNILFIVVKRRTFMKRTVILWPVCLCLALCLILPSCGAGTGEHEWGRIEHVQFHGKLGSNDERRSKINAGGEQCGKSYQLGYHHHPQKYNYHSKTNNHTGFYL